MTVKQTSQQLIQERIRELREYTIDGTGMHISKPFRDITGIISGSPTRIQQGELGRIGELFAEDAANKEAR